MLKFGLIGAGLRGSGIGDIVHRSAQAKISAVCDISDKNLGDAVKRYGAKAYKDYKTLIDENKDLDAIIVATPDTLHKDSVIYGANKGLHLFVEKPFATNVDDCGEMVTAIENAPKKIKVFVNFENRFNLPFVAVKKKIDEGELGKILTINCRLNDSIYVPTKMLPWAASSTVAWFLFPHALDLLCWFGGKTVSKVYAIGTKKKLVGMGIDTYDSIQGSFTFTDETTATITSTWILPESMPLIYDFKFEIVGEESAIYADTHNQMVVHLSDAYRNIHTIGTEVHGYPTGAANFAVACFLDNIENDTKPLVTVEEAVMNTKAIAAIHESLKTGNAIDL
ncbi:MAG: Gfo/Idh/MocA family oxidoreductase [Oscillospiraceae bacterium]|nr:Gfo/Idh/MocA family oxidoreductase [Oscillospiraceae bacterium]